MTNKTDEFNVSGILEKNRAGHGNLRRMDAGLRQLPDDIYVPQQFIRRFNIEDGALVEGKAKHHPKAPGLCFISAINGMRPDEWQRRRGIQNMNAITPNKALTLEHAGCAPSCRLIDLFTPLGRGQRALIVAPPRSGKTIIMEQMLEGVLKNHRDCEVMLLLVDERPEEVTHFRKKFEALGASVFASTNDEDKMSHLRLARLVFSLARAKAEAGRDVVLFMDSLTRLARAFNNALRGSGRTMSGGIDSEALTEPKKMFGLARQLEEGGSVTIVATALVETDSQMDELIFREFKGTGNMEIVLDRSLAEKALFPAINILQSGTRNDHLLMPADDFAKAKALRAALAETRKDEALRQILSVMGRYPSNAEMLKVLRA